MRFGIIGALIVIQGIIALAHYVLYKTIVRFVGIESPEMLFWLRLAFSVLSVSFVVMSLTAVRLYGPVIRVLYTTAAGWLGTLHWLVMAMVLSWVIFFAAKLLAPKLDVAPMVVTLLALALVTSAYGIWNSSQVKVNRVSVRLDQLPEQWRGRRAVVVADTHLGNIRNTNFAKKVTKLISDQQPDIVLFPGDLYDGTIDDYGKMVAPFTGITSRFGVYFAAGNHEEFRDRAAMLGPLRQVGIHVLDNEVVDVDGLQVIGINYSDATTAEKEKAVLDTLSLDKDRASILIKHVPDELETARDAGIDLQVSGHTHVGQMWPFSLVTKRIFGPFFYGLNPLDSLQVYTTSGAGTWGPPQRVGTTPEIAVITFE